MHGAMFAIADLALGAARVHVVAEVISYDEASHTVSVRPVQQVVRPDGSTARLPDVHGIPLAAQEMGGFVITGPASRGDVVMLHVPDQCIDRWLDDASIVDSDAERAGRQLANAIATPIGKPSAPQATGGNLVIGRASGGVQLVITPDGKVSLGTGGVDLVDTLYDALLGLATATVTIPSGGGSSLLSNAGSLASLASQVGTVKR